MKTRQDVTLSIGTIIADDHPLVLLAMENLISTFPNIEVVGKATDSSELFAATGRLVLVAEDHPVN